MTVTATARLPRPTVLEIDLGAAAANIRAVRQMVGPERRIFAVVKADGYGHGAAELGAVFVAHGADALAVADLGEGIRLRQRGITAPILVYPSSLPEAAPDALAHGLDPDARRSRQRPRVRGGGRRAVRGVRQDRRRTRAAGRSGRAGGEDHHGHAGAAASAPGRALRPSTRAGRCRSRLRRVAAGPVHRGGRRAGGARACGCRSGCSPPRPSCCASRRPTSTPSIPGACSTASRSPGRRSPIPLRPTLRALTTRVIALKEILPRERFAELAPFPVAAPMRLGVIPDGLGRWPGLAPRRRVLVRGRAAPIVSGPNLEHTRIDLTGVPEARVGDEVVIIGRQGEAEITAAEVGRAPRARPCTTWPPPSAPASPRVPHLT